MLVVLATFVTFIACAMAADAAFDRGGTVIDRVLLVAISIIAVIGVHLIPARAGRSPVAWMIWIGCLAAAIYGHMTFFSHSSLRAGEVRVAESAQMAGTERQIQVIRDSLAVIQARPIAVVTDQLAGENNQRVRSALRTEIAQGKRAEALRDELARLEASRTTTIETESVDPVPSTIASLTGWSSQKVMVAVGMFYALLVELIGAWIWGQALSKKETAEHASEHVPEQVSNNRNIINQDVSKSVAEVSEQQIPSNRNVPTSNRNVPEHVIDPELEVLMKMVREGKFKPTVRNIREHLECSTERAMELRNAVAARSELLLSA
jgi:hypothetical protein